MHGGVNSFEHCNAFCTRCRLDTPTIMLPRFRASVLCKTQFSRKSFGISPHPVTRGKRRGQCTLESPSSSRNIYLWLSTRRLKKSDRLFWTLYKNCNVRETFNDPWTLRSVVRFPRDFGARQSQCYNIHSPRRPRCSTKIVLSENSSIRAKIMIPGCSESPAPRHNDGATRSRVNYRIHYSTPVNARTSRETIINTWRCAYSGVVQLNSSFGQFRILRAIMITSAQCSLTGHRTYYDGQTYSSPWICTLHTFPREK